MWLAIVLVCSTPYSNSCTVFAKQDELFVTEESCKLETEQLASFMQIQGFYAQPTCFKIGETL